MGRPRVRIPETIPLEEVETKATPCFVLSMGEGAQGDAYMRMSFGQWWMRGASAVVFLLIALPALFHSGLAPRTQTTSAAGPSNVLFILTDDMRLDDLQYMPNVRGLIGDQGATFDNYFDNVTLCCPARTSILRGQYSHNTGVLTNGGSNGGFETAHARGVEQATVATAMHGAGYATGLFGKYLNGYPSTVGQPMSRQGGTPGRALPAVTPKASSTTC